MIVRRKAVLDDVPGMLALGLEAMEKAAYENLVVSPKRMESLAREVISSPQHFAMVAEKDGKIVGSVLALVHDCLFYERKQASVLQFYSKEPGEGIKLIRELLKWYQGRRGIKMLCFTLEAQADPRIGKILKRLGFNTELPVYMQTR